MEPNQQAQPAAESQQIASQAPQPAPQPQAQPQPQNNAPEPAIPQQTDDDEWTGAEADFVLNKGIDPGKPADDKDEPAPAVQQTPEQKKQADDDAAAKKKAEEEEAEKQKNETPEQTKARHEQEAAERKKAEESQPGPDNPALRDTRALQRQAQEELNAVKEDIREEMFSDVETELKDMDGDPIKTIEDVMRLQNPNTQKPFTKSEATAWLQAAQNHLNATLEDVEKKVEQYAEVQISLKDQADAIRAKYGELLKANPNGIRERLWNEFEGTLERDKKTGIIINAPVSMERLYEVALAPYERLATQMESDEQQRQTQQQQQQQQQQKQQKAAAQSDRSDIYAPTNNDNQDPEANEWAAAENAVFGDRLPRK